MPARSEAQRRYLFAHFGPEWVQEHHFNNTGPLPEHLARGGIAGEQHMSRGSNLYMARLRAMRAQHAGNIATPLTPDIQPGAQDEPKVQGYAKGSNWIQNAVNPAHKGYCTPMSKATCTPRRKALALRFKHGL